MLLNIRVISMPVFIYTLLDRCSYSSLYPYLKSTCFEERKKVFQKCAYESVHVKCGYEKCAYEKK